jgi:hypothetical protein
MAKIANKIDNNFDSIVSAHPSITMSCVAAKNVNIKKMAVSI